MVASQSVLILSSDTGGGHRSAARALEDSFLTLGDATGQIAVYISRVLESACAPSKMLGDIYNYLLRHHQDYMKYYFWLVNHLKPNESRLMIKSAKGYAMRLLDSVCPDVIVSVHPMTQHLFSYAMKRLKIRDKVPLVTVVTDPCYGFWKAWACQDVDQFYVATAGAQQQLVEYGISEEKIHIMGIPVHRQFYPVVADEKWKLQESLGLDPEKFTVFMNAGWIGGGNVPKLYRALAEANRQDLQIIFLAGKNQKLVHHAEKVAAHSDTPIQVLSYTQEMGNLMRASDVLVSKLGGLTTFEAMACGLPILADSITPPMPQEAETATFLQEKGSGILLKHPSEIVSVIQSLVHAPQQYAHLQQAALESGSPRASDDIAQDILKRFG